jgi:hypothetical protein
MHGLAAGPGKTFQIIGSRFSLYPFGKIFIILPAWMAWVWIVRFRIEAAGAIQ